MQNVLNPWIKKKHTQLWNTRTLAAQPPTSESLGSFFFSWKDTRASSVYVESLWTFRVLLFGGVPFVEKIIIFRATNEGSIKHYTVLWENFIEEDLGTLVFAEDIGLIL